MNFLQWPGGTLQLRLRLGLVVEGQVPKLVLQWRLGRGWRGWLNDPGWLAVPRQLAEGQQPPRPLAMERPETVD